MTGSLPFDEQKGCPAGYHKRKSYTSKLGHRVTPRCVKSTTVYAETRKNFTRRVLEKQSSRLRRAGKAATAKLKCPEGKIERHGYIRHFSTTIQKKGYTVKRASGKEYRIHPLHRSVYVKPGCVKDRGLKGKIAPGGGFGPLRKGELKKLGYVYKGESEMRRDALKKAVKVFGALGVYRKLDAVAKLSKRTAPKASDVFTADREWVKSHYDLKAF